MRSGSGQSLKHRKSSLFIFYKICSTFQFTPKKLLVHGLAFTVNLNLILSLFINLEFFPQLSGTRDIGDVHRSKPPPTVHYQKAMPDVDDLMQVFFLISKLQRSSTKHMFLLKRGQTKCIRNQIYPNNHPSPLPKIG